ncbi:DNA repair exonuclease [Wenzhouxiangella sp. XN79A]|uniref:metallophosphoesterase family protein n=1 Tax=Wenzhouxiangella sp. XN79A TaxID=2724193 RepID=UPI00144ADE65|nr:metallophosphoesterase [Wenzhouxiangella sp. XN79A]NKI35335.1 DNA repair exonuclease [Wenzhouxiangella sp. XN79A]
MKLLAVGDMHLGRLPVALPEALAERARDLGPDTAWSRCVDHALEHEVEAVVLAGDLVDRERDFFAGFNALKSGVERLTAAGIRVVAVAGNHDTEVLPRLADAIDGLTLLGRGGQWERLGLDEVDVLGWSFPSRHVTRSPLDTLPELAGDRPVIGLLHGDLDRADSRYAPLDSGVLARSGAAAWLLGHVHQPHPLDGEIPIGYLGSVSALRASDLGRRGPWRITLCNGRIRAEQQPLAPLAFEALRLDWTPDDEPGRLLPRIVEAAQRRVAARIEAGALPDALGLRIEITGETDHGEALRSQIEQVGDEARFEDGGCQIFVQKVVVDTRPPLDLDTLARRADPVGLIARDLQALTGADLNARQALIDAARPALADAVAALEFQPVAARLDDDAIGDQLARAARRALSDLMGQTR